jgi:hypothetical protein
MECETSREGKNKTRGNNMRKNRRWQICGAELREMLLMIE